MQIDYQKIKKLESIKGLVRKLKKIKLFYEQKN